MNDSTAMTSRNFIEGLFRLDGKVALVTGGATGIGRMIAEALAGGGARVLLASRREEACATAAAEINATFGPGSAEGFRGDVGSEEGVEALSQAVGDRCDALSILVNNAGKGWMSDGLEDFPYRGWESVFRVNVTGPFALTQKLLPRLQAAATPLDPARVVNIGSMVGSAPMGNNAYSYAASKAALHHLTRILGQELAPRSITVNALAPGPFPTQMTAWATSAETGQLAATSGVPLGRWGDPRDVAGALLFLCGAGGAYMTGAIIPLDGGVTVSATPELFEDLES
jgi:NAD(P)-dependent dehydrogenase (short-subunit alcohol dehydrogenase family)